MSKVLWLLGYDEQYQGELKNFLDFEVECRLFDDPLTALASFNGPGKPDMVIADHKRAGSFLENFGSLQEVPVVVTTDEDCYTTACNILKQGVADFVYSNTPASIMAAKVKHCLESRATTRSSQFKDCKIDNIYRKITTPKGRSATFTSKEFQIVMAFARREPPLITRNDLIQEVWGGVKVGQKTLDVHLFNILKKIASIHMEIRFEAPHSYRLCPLKVATGAARPLAAQMSNLS